MCTEFEITVLKELNTHNNKFEAIDKRFDDVDKKFKNISDVLESLKQSVILIEQKVTVDIPALFDGYSAHQDIQERQQGEIDSLNKKVDMHDIRISILEQKSL